MNQDWNANAYSKDFSFVHNYGVDVLELIDQKSAHSVLDLGCGNGALTKELADRGFKAQGIDASPEMIEMAQASYPDLTFRCSDATDFSLDEPVDAVFSNAVFHWIDKDKQLSMMKCVNQALRKGGQFVFEMGGWKNNALIHAALNETFGRAGYIYQIPFYFPSIGEYAALLEEADFKVTYALLFDRPTPLKGDDGLADWIRMFLNVPFASVKEENREPIIRETVECLKACLYHDDTWYCDYVRLRMKAEKL